MADRLPPELLSEATAHASWAESKTSSCDRLAFVGDSLLSQIVTMHLDRTFPRGQFPPGVLSRIRARVVSDETLREVASGIGLDTLAVQLAPDDRREQALAIVSDGKPLASMMEALIAACWLEHGEEMTTSAVLAALAPAIDAAAAEPVELKSRLQEVLARRGETVRYETAQAGGTEHAPVFEAVAFRDPDGTAIGVGSGRSKKAAETAAAGAALAGLEGAGG